MCAHPLERFGEPAELVHEPDRHRIDAGPHPSACHVLDCLPRQLSRDCGPLDKVLIDLLYARIEELMLIAAHTAKGAAEVGKAPGADGVTRYPLSLERGFELGKQHHDPD